VLLFIDRRRGLIFRLFFLTPFLRFFHFVRLSDIGLELSIWEDAFFSVFSPAEARQAVFPGSPFPRLSQVKVPLISNLCYEIVCDSRT